MENVQQLVPRVAKITKKEVVVLFGEYAMAVIKSRKGFTVEMVRFNDSDVPTVLFRADRERLGDAIASTGDPTLIANREAIEEVVSQIVAGWETLQRARMYEELRRRYGLATGNGIVSLQAKPTPHHIPKTYVEIRREAERLLGPQLTNLLEFVLSVALTLRLVDRASGVKDNRPLWALVVGNPGSFKTTVLSLLTKSPNVFVIDDVTASGLLPAKDDIPPLVKTIHNKVTIMPTLSTIASQDRQQAMRLFAFLERVYDGEIKRKTGLGDVISAEVDTVIIGAITPEIYEQFTDIMIAYGSRWLVYHLFIEDEDALEIVKKMMAEKTATERLRVAVSGWLDNMLENVDYRVIDSAYIDSNYSEDLVTLAELMARLRVVYRRHRFYDEEEGKFVEEVYVVQRDVVSRPYVQLVNLVKANAVVRGTQEVVGLPTVDDKAMRLAARVAISSTTLPMSRIISALILRCGVVESLKDLAKLAGYSVKATTVRTRVLEQVGVVKIHEVEGARAVELSDRFRNVLLKYLAPDCLENEKS